MHLLQSVRQEVRQVSSQAAGSQVASGSQAAGSQVASGSQAAGSEAAGS